MVVVFSKEANPCKLAHNKPVLTINVLRIVESFNIPILIALLKVFAKVGWGDCNDMTDKLHLY